ncbi:mitochondrial carrier domain-containing protein [Fimicolochytrium jonesii]|uniref:mitochondrial carrier domain-containing protein n=1 Tax=Fimicolochytrium jonesii TaxID=1396493 RepID=UPI0022FE465E|nr:mitochondrial carrier domain-containing protein [Fimicolochytrium jonesii]KAI8821304.1 mitochondrial carrier domain-containing protein [Fimicolochytrium jonesii]
MSVTGGAKVSVAPIPGLYPVTGKPRQLGAFEHFAMSALAPAGAVIFTNPFDTAKVRLQLQGEKLRQAKTGATAAASAQSQTVYKNSFDTIYKIYINEGIKGLQKGLTPAILREGSKNLFRIGMFDPILATIHDNSKGKPPAWKRMVAGSMCGVMGAISCNPFELVKTRLQSASKSNIAVGTQHGYTGTWNALSSIYKADGVRGLYRGSILSMFRSIFGSGSNLAAYSIMKDYLITERQWNDNAWLDMVCGLASGIVSCICMNPIDVTRTRYYNQQYVDGKGVMYSNGIDAIRKIAKNEGLTAFYKGLTTHFLRIGPHFCLTFVFLGILRRGCTDFYSYLDMRDSFSAFDKDGNGMLDQAELRDALQKVVMSRGELGYDAMITSYADRILEQADVDHDNMINPKEYPAMVKEVTAIVGERNRKQ